MGSLQGHYRVTSIVNEPKHRVRLVLYRALLLGMVWSRPPHINTVRPALNGTLY